EQALPWTVVDDDELRAEDEVTFLPQRHDDPGRILPAGSEGDVEVVNADLEDDPLEFGADPAEVHDPRLLPGRELAVSAGPLELVVPLRETEPDFVCLVGRAPAQLREGAGR